MEYLKSLAKRTPIISELIRIYGRRKRALWPYKEKIKLAKQWSYKKTEFSNYYYDLTERNKRDLAFTISQITNVSVEEIQGYFREIDTNHDVFNRLMAFREIHPELRDSSMQIARRVGWYAFIRIVKPRLVIETGVHNGVGALIICEALRKNLQQNFSGEYLGTDINPKAGELLKDHHREIGRVIIQDSLETLRDIKSEIDIFINDSDHSFDYEMAEYKTINNNLSPHSIILGDNSNETDALRDFSQSNMRNFLFFQEVPLNHFYAGNGVGISYKSEFLLHYLSRLKYKTKMQD